MKPDDIRKTLRILHRTEILRPVRNKNTDGKSILDTHRGPSNN